MVRLEAKQVISPEEAWIPPQRRSVNCLVLEGTLSVEGIDKAFSIFALRHTVYVE